MAVVACDHHRMAETNANANGIGSSHSNANGGGGGSGAGTTTQVMESRNLNPINIYSANNVLRTATTNTLSNGAGVSRGGPREGLKGTPFPFLGSRGKENINLLSSKEHQIDELESCCSVNEVKVDHDLLDKTILIFDLTTNGFLLSPAAAKQVAKPEDDNEDGYANSNSDVYRIHLSLPSTLVKRPKFDFDKLLQTVIDDSKRLKLINLIENCSTFLFYDGSSKITSCGLPTYFLIKKFSAFLHGQLGKNHVQLYILEKMDKPVGKGLDSTKALHEDTDRSNDSGKDGNNKKGPVAEAASKKLNLSIKILPKTTDKMFIQSIKKDTVHYSPKSLKKFFKFHIPQELDNQDKCLPTWLKPFCNRDNADSILQKLLSNFEYLEDLELKRLEKGLTTETNHDQRNLQDSASYHKIYSLSNLQKDFRKQKKAISTKQTASPSASTSRTSSPVDSVSNLKLCIPPPSNVLTKVDTNHLSPHVDTDSSDSMLTPMDSYEMSQGIQAFTKNRYSNILPYEHSRVKLQASPINGPNGGMSFSQQNNNTNSTNNTTTGNNNDNSSNADSSANNKNTYNSITVKAPGHGNDTERTSGSNTRKRRSSSLSYFNQGIGTPQREKELDKNDASKEKFNDYFNANYLKIPQVNADFNYIATQAPLPSTVDDFWKVVSTNQVKVIISLNSTDELYMRKWDIYWNNNRSNSKYTIDIVDAFENACNVEGCILRVFKIYKNGEEADDNKSIVFQLQYTKWLDSCGIVMEDIVSLCRIKNMLLHNPTELLEDLRDGVCKDTEKYSNEAWTKKLQDPTSSAPLGPARQPPLLVHCSAGCGRTGVFITLDFILNILMEPTNANNSIDVWNMPQDLIFITVNELRKQRISMVQNLTQYITCYESILEFFAFQKRRVSSPVNSTA